MTIDLEDGQYGGLLYCTGAGSGDVTIPVTVTYADASTEEGEMTAIDWYLDAQQGLSTVINNMDRFNVTTGLFDDANNPALFFGSISLDPAKTLNSITLRPSEANVNWETGANVVFNLMAITAVDHASYAITRESVNGDPMAITVNEALTYRDVDVGEDTFVYTMTPTTDGIELGADALKTTF